MSTIATVREQVNGHAASTQIIRIVGGADGHFKTIDNGKVQNGGGQAYPFLLGFDEWEIRTRSADVSELDATNDLYPSLRLVRESKVSDVCVPTEARIKRLGDLPGLYGEVFMFGMPAEAFLQRVGLRVSLCKGAEVASKRLARLFSPYRFWTFYRQNEVNIVHSDKLDGKLWDGCGLMSRDYLKRCIPHMLVNVPEKQHEAYRRQLESAQRVEITVMHAGGQEKGDCLIADHMPEFAESADFLFPSDSTKSEVRYTKGVFVGFKAIRHAKHHMRLDVQSLINHHAFFGNARLLAWLEQDSAEFIQNIETGKTEQLMSRLLNCDSAEQLANLRSWWLGDYFISGGKAMWFAGIVQALGRQRTRLLSIQTGKKHRFPICGGRYYIMPAAVGDMDVPSGHVTLKKACATAFVNDKDWLEFIVDVLGGCDGDDAVWVVPFRDSVDEVESTSAEITYPQKLLIWRSPNMPGEWVMLRPTVESDAINDEWPLMDSSRLSPRIDTVDDIEIGSLVLPNVVDVSAELQPLTVQKLKQRAKLLKIRGISKLRKQQLIDKIVEKQMAYAVHKMTPAIAQAVKNRGVLGGYVNVQMVCQAVFGRIPRRLPAPLEQVIDVVKDGRDLSPVKRWCEQIVRQLAKGNYPIPAALVDRISHLTEHKLTLATNHWFDKLLADAQSHLDKLQQDIDQLSLQCLPPLQLFDVGATWQEQALTVHAAYSQTIGKAISKQQVNAATYYTAYEATEKTLTRWAAHETALFAGLVSLIYMGGLLTPKSDNLLWQTNQRDMDNPEIAQRFIDALRGLGILATPIWSDEGALLSVGENSAESKAVPLSLSGTWFNLLRVQHPNFTRMGDVSKRDSLAAKRQLMQLAPKFVDQVLSLELRDKRLVARTARGNLFGYVTKGQERFVASATSLRITHIRATKDGNINAVVIPQ
ncbi:MAG: Rho termination factor N-terminal domain-containing protein [Candidatus Promineifilaceae bacterium]